MKKIYLAAPYSHALTIVKKQRFHKINKKAGELMQEGYIVFSPISHSHPIDLLFNDPQDHDFWLRQDVHFLDWADEVWVYALEGWEKSYGVNWEIKYAKQHGKPVVMINEL